MSFRTKSSFVVGGALGAALVYLLDPDLGRSRRTRLRDQAAARIRRRRRDAERQAMRAESERYGAEQRALHPIPADPRPDDATLAHKVESEVFGSPDVPKGDINVNVAEGIVDLRGQASSEELIREIERRTRAVWGVRDVNNLLHLPGEVAPNEAAVREIR